jgi:hypothetical protein
VEIDYPLKESLLPVSISKISFSAYEREFLCQVNTFFKIKNIVEE